VQHYRQARYDLDRIKELIVAGRCIVTLTALTCGQELGYTGRQEIKDRVLKLKKSEIYKTMTVNDTNFKDLWQDVYKTSGIDEPALYIKLQISRAEEAVIISFKEA